MFWLQRLGLVRISLAVIASLIFVWSLSIWLKELLPLNPMFDSKTIWIFHYIFDRNNIQQLFASEMDGIRAIPLADKRDSIRCIIVHWAVVEIYWTNFRFSFPCLLSANIQRILFTSYIFVLAMCFLRRKRNHLMSGGRQVVGKFSSKL